MIKIFKKGLASLVMLASVLLVGLPVCAHGKDVGGSVTKANIVNEVQFSNLDTNPSQSYEGVDEDGNPYTISIEEVTQTNDSTLLNSMYSTSSTIITTPARTWNVKFTGVLVNCNFDMTVYNNKVTSVENYSILTVGCTYASPSLTKKSTYGKLQFTTTSYGSLVSFSAWLKGTVTGSSNDISITYSM